MKDLKRMLVIAVMLCMPTISAFAQDQKQGPRKPPSPDIEEQRKKPPQPDNQNRGNDNKGGDKRGGKHGDE